jgi:hypothetical protein
MRSSARSDAKVRADKRPDPLLCEERQAAAAGGSGSGRRQAAGGGPKPRRAHTVSGAIRENDRSAAPDLSSAAGRVDRPGRMGSRGS